MLASVESEWSFQVAIRSEFARRQALIEIDVLVAQQFGLTLEQLIELYEIYFPVAQKKERNTYFDANGSIVWISAKGLNNVGLIDAAGKKWTRSAWQNFLTTKEQVIECDILDDTQPGGPLEVTRHFVGPFTQCDRIEDYRRAWAHFERLKSEEAV